MKNKKQTSAIDAKMKARSKSHNVRKLQMSQYAEIDDKGFYQLIPRYQKTTKQLLPQEILRIRDEISNKYPKYLSKELKNKFDLAMQLSRDFKVENDKKSEMNKPGGTESETIEPEMTEEELTKKRDEARRILNKWLKKERIEFIKLCYEAAEKTSDRIEEQLNVEAKFIKSKTFPQKPEKAKMFLSSILAGNHILFAEEDEEYRNKKVNAASIKDYNRRYKYSGKPLEYITNAKELKNLPSGTGEKFVTLFCRSVECAIQYQELLDKGDDGVPTISIHDLKLSEDQLKIFFDSIFDQAWLYLEEMPGTESPKKLAPAIYGERGVKLTYYKVRKLRLEKLMNGFYLKSNNLLNLKTLNIECFFPEADNDPSSPHMQSVCDSILQYFQNLDPTKPLLDPNSETYIRKLKTLKNRILWAERRVPRNWLPVFLTYMTKCCKYSLTIEKEVSVKNTATDQSCQERYFQIILLKELCDCFRLTKANYKANINQYLYWCDKYIKSLDEANLWREILSKNKIQYEDIPFIGFQLCCLDYLQDRTIPNLEKLSYRLVSVSHLRGYNEFWKLNQDRIIAGAETVKEYPQVIDNYLELLHDPKNLRHIEPGSNDRMTYRMKFLDDMIEQYIPIDLSGYSIPEVYPDLTNTEDASVLRNIKDLKRLILETQLKICINQKSIKSLQNGCVSIYGFSRYLFKSINEIISHDETEDTVKE